MPSNLSLSFVTHNVLIYLLYKLLFFHKHVCTTSKKIIIFYDHYYSTILLSLHLTDIITVYNYCSHLILLPFIRHLVGNKHPMHCYYILTIIVAIIVTNHMPNMRHSSLLCAIMRSNLLLFLFE